MDKTQAAEKLKLIVDAWPKMAGKAKDEIYLIMVLDSARQLPPKDKEALAKIIKARLASIKAKRTRPS